MANDAEKKRLKRNADALFLLYSVTGAVHAVYVLVCLVLGYGLSVRRGLVGVLHGAVMVLDALVVYTLRNWAASGVDLADPGVRWREGRGCAHSRGLPVGRVPQGPGASELDRGGGGVPHRLRVVAAALCAPLRAVQGSGPLP